MKIGLHDADAEHLKHKRFPNYALMKISAWHKSQGDQVQRWDPHIPMEYFDQVYSSKIFDFTPVNPYLPKDVITGGTGYDIYTKLPQAIDDAFPDYSLYSGCDYSIGYITRGCPNKCRWCVVPLSGISDKYTYQEIGVIRNLCLKRTKFIVYVT